MATPKIRTLIDLSEQIDGELGWRKRELSYLKTAIGRNSSAAQATYIRASVAILYAHWEGFVVATLRAYVSYVNWQKEPLDRLAPAVRVGAVISSIKRMERERTSSARADFLKEYHAGMQKKLDLKGDKWVDAESNLNASRFLGLLACAGIDTSHFETSSKFLDESLVARRNAICHGEYVDLDLAAYSSIEADVIALMEAVKGHALDSAENKKFLVA